MIENQPRITDPDDPRRCKRVIGDHQCLNMVVEGREFCRSHCSDVSEKPGRTYRLAKWKSRVADFADDSNIKSLREEIGILRMLIEEKLNSCTDSYSLLLNSGPLSELLLKVEKLVMSCNRLDDRLGNLLDKTRLVILAQQIIEIIVAHVDDEVLVEKVANDIQLLFSQPSGDQ